MSAGNLFLASLVLVLAATAAPVALAQTPPATTPAGAGATDESATTEAPDQETVEPDAAAEPSPSAAAPVVAPSPSPSPPPTPAAPVPAAASASSIWQASADPEVVGPLPPAPEEEPDEYDGTLGSHQSHFMGVVGVRTAFIRHDGFDPFAESDSLVQFSLGFGRTVLTADETSLVVMAGWDVGGRSADVRGDETRLGVHRLALGPELRQHFVPWLYAFAKIQAAALRTVASLESSAVGVTLYQRAWSWGFDATAGAAVEIIGKRSGASKRPRIWVLGELGYGWSSEIDLKLEPDSDETGQPQRVEAIDLGTVAVRGPMFRVSGALSF